MVAGDVNGILQAREVCSLIVLVLGYIPVILAYRKYDIRLFFLAYTGLVIAGVSTVLETEVLTQSLNYLEHIAILVSSSLFAACAYRSHQTIMFLEEEITEKGEIQWS